MRIIDFVGVLQLMCLFLCCHSGKLPKYQAIVYPEVFDARDDEDTTVLRINDDITLHLKPSSVLHPEFFLRTYRQGVPQHTYFNVEALEQNLYDDEKRLAAVIMTEEDGALQLKGVVGPNLKIMPAVGMERSEDGHHPHILETIHDTDNDYVYGKLPEEGLTQLSARYLQLDSSAYNIDTVYPEVFVVIDSEFYREFKSYEDMLFYMLVEFKVVNLRYRTVSQPKIQPVYRGIEITTYKQEHKYFTYIGAGINALKSLYAIGEFVKENNDTYGMYDMVYFITGRDMIAVEGSRQESVLQGFAFVASACTDKRQQLGEDKAYSYIGIRIMAHEMGHTLGCSHDGTNVDGIIRSFKSDSSNCPWQDGYIMSYIEEDSRSYQFSSCCNYMMSLVSWSVEASCLRKNETITKIEKIKKTIYLPGQMLDKDTQCRMTYPTLRDTYYMKKFGVEQCVAQCYVNGRQFSASDSHWPMLLIDGSVCDYATNRVCINGRCVPASLPKYKPKKKKNKKLKETHKKKHKKSTSKKTKRNSKENNSVNERGTKATAE
ncbi:metalloprotease mig-17-like [Dermacentor silvarum]|uniref:metalloprotease mig-17-like n=1 Tax=Dermacentor silvarum TaxID=543639 RepID=UPI00189B0FD4|nr:metalloprotease mig-17-like [Dermacentor silvarum]